MLKAYEVIEHLPHVSLGEIAFITDGQHGYHTIDENSDIKHLTAQSIQNGFVTFANTDRISEEMHLRNQRSICEVGDVLLSTAGTIGNAGVITGDILPANIDQDVARIKIHDQKKVNPWYLCAFLNSRYGKLQTTRESTGQVQQHLALEKVRRLRIPLISTQAKIAQIGKRSFELFQESKQLYADAENLLASELGLKKFETPQEDITTLKVSDVLNAGRIDAEYFHPQKTYTKEWLGKFPGKIVSDYFKSVRDIYNPPNQDTGKSIFNFDLTHALHYFLDDDGEVIPENEIGSLKKHIKKNDVVVSRLRSYLKEIAIVEVPESVAAVGSSEFIVLRANSKELFPEALLVYLRSVPVQTILKWSQDGSNHPRFQENELLAIKVPDKVLKIQTDIRKMIQEGIKVHREAKRLLAEAKSEVERLIEGK